jgi:hypothetical protein
MRKTLVACVIAIAAGSAIAKPLPKGWRVFAKDGKLYVERDKVVLPIVDPEVSERAMFGELKSAKLSDDGTKLVLDVGTCTGGDEPTEIAVADVEARFENASGMQVHVKKKYADAIAHFTTAAQKDPLHPVYATNLLSAQSMAQKLDDADKTLATYGPKHVVWFAWRLAVDPELANVAGRASAKALVADKPSKLTFDALGDDVAVSPRGFVAAREWSGFGGPGAIDETHLVIYELATSSIVLRLPVVAACLTQKPAPDQPVMGEVCTKQELARIAAQKKEADRLLAILGFEKRKTTWTDPKEGADKYTSPDKSTTIDISTAKVARGKITRNLPADTFMAKLLRIGFAGDHVAFKFRESGYAGCSGDAQRSYTAVFVVK